MLTIKGSDMISEAFAFILMHLRDVMNASYTNMTLPSQYRVLFSVLIGCPKLFVNLLVIVVFVW